MALWIQTQTQFRESVQVGSSISCGEFAKLCHSALREFECRSCTANEDDVRSIVVVASCSSVAVFFMYRCHRSWTLTRPCDSSINFIHGRCFGNMSSLVMVLGRCFDLFDRLLWKHLALLKVYHGLVVHFHNVIQPKLLKYCAVMWPKNCFIKIYSFSKQG